MKKKILFPVLFIAVTLFTACEKDEPTITKTVDFEDVALTDGVKSDASFASGGMNFDCLFSDYYGGFVCSSKTDKSTAGFLNQYSVYANGGASGSNFALFTPPYGAETFCSFPNEASYEVKKLKLTNSTYAYLAIKDGNDGNNPPYVKTGGFTSGDFFKVTITGYAGETQTGTVDFYLADFRNGKSYICDKWTSVNLESLGKITKLGIAFDSTDKGDYGINTPQYVCIDDIEYVVDGE
ncbi:MAG: DUF4465 domain-containing protein [Dysgonamonadaceae bacterium]|jgi:hypothetical protein|nr:DUF4465 domain-containing protein [Dysgonamonadaceae bacterium]